MKKLILMFVFLCFLMGKTRAQENAKQTIKVEVQKNGKTTASVSLLGIRIKVKAGSGVLIMKTGSYESEGGVTYNRASGVMTLNKNAAVTVVQDGGYLRRFVGDKIIIKAPESKYEVQVDQQYYVLDRLADAFRIDPKITLFRLNLSFAAGPYTGEQTALFNRHNHTLCDYGTDVDEDYRGGWRTLCSGVTQGMFRKIAASDTTKSYGQVGPIPFEELKKYGCLVKKF